MNVRLVYIDSHTHTHTHTHIINFIFQPRARVSVKGDI